MNPFDQFDAQQGASGGGASNPFDQFDAPKATAKGYLESIRDAGGSSIAKRGIGLFQTAEDIGLPVHKLFGVDKAAFDKATSDATRNENQAAQGTGITGAISGAVLDPINFMLPSMGAAKGAGMLAKIGAGAKAGALYGAAAGGTGAITEDQSRIGEAAKGGVFGAGVGAAIPIAGAAISKASNAVGGVYNRLASLLGNENAQGNIADNIIAKKLVSEGFTQQEVESALQDARQSGLMPTLGEATGSSGVQQVEKSIIRGQGEGANTMRDTLFDRNKNIVPSTLQDFAGGLKQKAGNVSDAYKAAADEAAQRSEIPFTAQEAARLPIANDAIQAGDNGLTNFYQAKLDELNGKFGAGDSSKKPILSWIKESGGISTESKAAQELNSMGINSSTYPALFRKQGGIGDLDNIPLSEFNKRFGLTAKDGGNGYVDRDWLLNTLKNEKFKAGNAPATDTGFINALNDAGIDYRTAKGSDVFNALHPDEAERLAIQSESLTKPNPIQSVNDSIRTRLSQLGGVNNIESKALKQAQAILDNAKARGNSFDALLDAKKQLDDLFIEGADANAQKNASRYVAQYSKQITDTLNELAPTKYGMATQAAKTNMAANDILDAVNSTNQSSLAALYNKVWAKPELQADFLRKLPDDATRQQAITLFSNLEKIKRGFGGSDTAFNLPANNQLANEAGIGFDPRAFNSVEAPQTLLNKIGSAAQAGVYKQIARQSVNPDVQRLIQAMQKASGQSLMKDVTPYVTNGALITGEHALEAPASKVMLPAPVMQPMENNQYSPQSSNDPIGNAAQATGINPQLLQLMAQRESGGNPNARAKTSSAKGLFQFTTSTWNEMVQKYGQQFGITKAGIFDPSQNAMAAALYAKDNAQYLAEKIGRAPTDAEIYMAHFLGAKGAAKLLNSTGQENAVALFPQAAQANRSIFYDGMKPRTTAQVYQIIANKLEA
jgi:hypothetical protein